MATPTRAPHRTAAWIPGTPPDGEPSAPPSALPQYPALADFRALDDRMRALGVRHAAELLRPGTEFRVLDGLWFPGRGFTWVPAGPELVGEAVRNWRESKKKHAPEALALTERLAELAADGDADGSGAQPPAVRLRRFLLWQLGCRLAEAPGPIRAEDVAALGVAEPETAPLAAAFTAGFPADPQLRARAEGLTGAWPGGDPHAVAAQIDALPNPDGDPLLAALRREVRRGAAEVAATVAEARRLTAAGRPRDAAAYSLAALDRSPTEPDALAALLAVSAALADEPGERSADAAVELGGRIRVRWPQPRRGGDAEFRVYRFADGAPQDAVELSGADAAARTAVDAGPPVGCPLRYAVVPLRDGRPAGVPLASAPVLVAPPADAVRAIDGPESVRVRWRVHPSAVDVRVERDGEPVPCGRTGLVDRPARPGVRLYRVFAGYRGARGETVWSTPSTATVRLADWPLPVDRLTTRLLDDGLAVRITADPPKRGTPRLVPWHGPLPKPGTDITTRLRHAPSRAAGTGASNPPQAQAGPPPHSGMPPQPPGTAPATAAAATAVASVAPAPGERLRLVAVSEAEGRAVAGAGVVVERPAPVANAAAYRMDSATAEIRFDWPEPAILVRITVEQEGRRSEQHIARAQYTAAGSTVEIPVTGAGGTVHVEPVSRPGSVVVAAHTAAAAAVLPPAAPPLPMLPPEPRRPWWIRAARARALRPWRWTWAWARPATRRRATR